MEISVLVGIISGSVAIVAATIAPVLSSLVTKYWDHRTIKLELFFHEKVKAYTKFFEAADRLESDYSATTISEFSSASARILLFAPAEIHPKIREFIRVASLASKTQQINKRRALDVVGEAGALRKELIRLLHKDLKG